MRSARCFRNARAWCRATTPARRAGSAGILQGFLLMLDFPLGIGPMQFTNYFTEDPHNSFLDAFVAGGWLGGIVHATLMVVTSGLRLSPGVPSRAVAAHLYRGLRDVRGRGRRKLHHRRAALAALLSADRRDLGPDCGRATRGPRAPLRMAAAVSILRRHNGA